MAELAGTKIKPIPVEDKEIGIDLDDTFQEDIFDAVQMSQFDSTAIDSFTNVAQTRENIYNLIDTMAQDNKVSAILETISEDVCQTNENGKIVWCESSDEKIAKYVNFLLDSLNVDKHVYKWVYNLIKYGDIYIKLFRESDYGEDILFKTNNKKDKDDRRLNESAGDKEQLDESIIVNVEDEDDHYVHYVEAVANPGEMFELTRFGKSMGYIKAPINVQKQYDVNDVLNYYLTYKMKPQDVEVFSPTSYVHGCIESNISRNPEEVNIFLNDEDLKEGKVNSSYTVRKGQSILYNKFRTWRELSLLENSVLLNRITKSALIRIVTVDVGDMPPEKIEATLGRLKSKIEQKSALNVDNSMNNYTNPGPIENTIYVPVHETKGQINFQTLGGDVDVKSLADIEYFENDFYGGFSIPKQFFGRTNDNTGFNGGTSLTILSSRYGKSVMKIQNIIAQMITDLINLFLLDKGLKTYVNDFTIKMQTPITQESIDRNNNLQDKVGVVSDVMNTVSSVCPDELIQLKITKELLSTTSVTPNVLALLQERIDELEAQEDEGKDNNNDEEDEKDLENDLGPSSRRRAPSMPTPKLEPEENEGEELGGGELEGEEPTNPNAGEETLPSFDDLGINGLEA